MENGKGKCFAIFLLPKLLREVEVCSTTCNADCKQNVARYVHFILGNDSCHLYGNGATNLRDELREKFPKMTKKATLVTFTGFIQQIP